ncbi:MAG TPA: slipin family protein [Frankiaceae bacterium]|nr:slipin family protein [Frankiaceae bacterium]
MRKVTVMEWERYVRYDAGRRTGVLGPGRHWVGRRTRLVHVDTRPRTMTVPGQEVLTADGVGVRASVAVVTEVADAVTYVESAVSAADALYAEVQLALRTALAAVPSDGLLDARAAIDAALFDAAVAAGERYGITVLRCGLRDLMFPGELRKVFAQAASARQEAKAALERARGETAALRSLANAARAVESQPALLRLRTLQAVESAAAATVVLTDR